MYVRSVAGVYFVARIQSNIVKGPDDLFYMIIQLIPPEGHYWNCLMRTDDLADPDSWRFWTGSKFDGRFVDPYTDSFSDAEEHICPPIDFESILDMSCSLTDNEYLGRYILLCEGTENGIEGVYYSLSPDLIHWIPRRLLFEIRPPRSESGAKEIEYGYPSLLDPQSSSRNFDRVGKEGYIYYTRFNDTTGETRDRDLVRVPIEFFRY